MAALSCGTHFHSPTLPKDGALAALLLYFERLCHTIAGAIAKCHLPHMLVCQPQLPRYNGACTPHRIWFVELIGHGRTIHGGNQLSKEGHYAEPRMESTQKTRLRVPDELRPEIADALRAARRSLGYTQNQLAEVLGSSQGAITRWERAIDSPPISAISILARIVPQEQKAFWFSAGAISDNRWDGVSGMRQIPILRDAAAAGTPRDVDEREIDFTLSFPSKMLPNSGRIIGVRVVGDSMSPILEEGYIALIDVTRRKADELVGRMIAARDKDGVTLKWLRRQSKDLYLLLPHNTSQRHPVQVIEPGGEWSLIGEVVKWIGEPHPPKRKQVGH